MSTELYDIPLKTIEGKDATLADYKGGVLLVVNVASAGGSLLPQYGGLEKIYGNLYRPRLQCAGLPLK